MTKEVRISLAGILLVALLLIITPTRRWILNVLAVGNKQTATNVPPREKIKLPGNAAGTDTAKKPCPCDTAKIREGWRKITPRKAHKKFVPRREKQITPPPSPSTQKVEIDMKITGKVEVQKQSPPPATQDMKKETSSAPCDTCYHPKKWKSHFWGKEFNEKNERRNQN